MSTLTTSWSTELHSNFYNNTCIALKKVSEGLQSVSRVAYIFSHMQHATCNMYQVDRGGGREGKGRGGGIIWLYRDRPRSSEQPKTNLEPHSIPHARDLHIDLTYSSTSSGQRPRATKDALAPLNIAVAEKAARSADTPRENTHLTHGHGPEISYRGGGRKETDTTF